MIRCWTRSVRVPGMSRVTTQAAICSPWMIEINRLLLARRGNGVLSDTGVIERHTPGDGVRGWSLVGMYPQVMRAQLADGRTLVEIDQRATYPRDSVAAAPFGLHSRDQLVPGPRPPDSSPPPTRPSSCTGRLPPFLSARQPSSPFPHTPAATNACGCSGLCRRLVAMCWTSASLGRSADEYSRLAQGGPGTRDGGCPPGRLVERAASAKLSDKWSWALPDREYVRLVAITDRSVSKVLAWAPRRRPTSYRLVAVSDIDGPVVDYETTGPSGGFSVPAGATSLLVGFGHGQWKRIINEPLADVVENAWTAASIA